MLSDRYVSVTRLTRHIKQLMESDIRLQGVWLKGEISNFKRHSRGHLYMTIKDKNARIRAVMFAGNARRLTFKPEDGMKVLIQGAISVYEPYGEYQIYIREMEQDGLGRLYLAFEALKKKLEARGLFDRSVKKPLPPVPYEIGIITSPTGAAIRDLFTTIKRRFPAARLTVFPVLVQGAEAAPSIAAAIRRANRAAFLDVLIVGRGGGSIEDLWAFNEEIVAQAIYQSHLPIVSAVGHETDFTIADFVADKRAPTPTAAGEFVVPNAADLSRRIDGLADRLSLSVMGKLNREKEQLKRIRESYAFKYPGHLILQKEQERDEWAQRLQKAAVRMKTRYEERLETLWRLLLKHHPEEMLNRSHNRLEERGERLIRAIRVFTEQKKGSSERLILQLNALSPLKIMARGYNLAYDRDGHLIHSVRSVTPGDSLDIKMHDGTIDCQVWGIEEANVHERSE
ncbi:exodeoxyribonuclease VII large subunit [Sporolactobacillus sp. THM7-7]|nr:exodeoxyribonuclease VII large subunit [Sporolactobacillus sp. THM7-7]